MRNPFIDDQAAEDDEDDEDEDEDEEEPEEDGEEGSLLEEGTFYRRLFLIFLNPTLHQILNTGANA